MTASKKLSIGVVCEGPTDFVAIVNFLAAALLKRNIFAMFVPIQPAPGKSDDAGWTRVFFWLEQNPPYARTQSYLGDGLFANNLNQPKCDVLLIQLDADILDDVGFCNFMAKKSIKVGAPNDSNGRAQEVRRLLEVISRVQELTDADRRKHVFGVSVYSSETWCVAAFSRVSYDPEELTGQALWDAFGECMLRSEGRAGDPPFGPPDKNVRRRTEYCERHADSGFLEIQSRQFKTLVDETAVHAKSSA